MQPEAVNNERRRLWREARCLRCGENAGVGYICPPCIELENEYAAQKRERDAEEGRRYWATVASPTE